MRLVNVHITKFRSVVDSGSVEIGDVTCLVGKNESGKTSFLTAMEQLNPADGDRSLDVVRDYPRWMLGEGEAAIESGQPPVVVSATYELTDAERTRFSRRFGAGTLTSSVDREVTYDNNAIWRFNSDEATAVSHLVGGLGSPRRAKVRHHARRTTRSSRHDAARRATREVAGDVVERPGSSGLDGRVL
jgi:energy-coupling factor transporter ATP-binding protein EcfA2